jgi:hypothetical protein
VYRNWETEHYNSVLEITVLFLGIHKWDPDIYIAFSIRWCVETMDELMNAIGAGGALLRNPVCT